MGTMISHYESVQDGAISGCGSLNENDPLSFMYLNAWFQLVNCLGRIRGWGPVGRSVPLVVGFSGSKITGNSELDLSH